MFVSELGQVARGSFVKVTGLIHRCVDEVSQTSSAGERDLVGTHGFVEFNDRVV